MLDTVGLAVSDISADLPAQSWKEVDGSRERRRDYGDFESDEGQGKLKVKHIKKSGQLLVEGSCARFYQGHNIVSSNDAIATAFSMLRAVKDKHGIKIPLRRAKTFARGEDIAVTRVDVPVMLRVPEGLSVGGVINGLACAAIRCGINMSLYHNETFYFDQHSQTSALKGYDKDVEIESHRNELELPATETATMLRALAKSTVRLEGVFRKKHFDSCSLFKDREIEPRVLVPRVLATMFLDLINNYDLRGCLHARLRQSDLLRVPYRQRGTVAYWESGGDMLRYFDNNMRSFRRHRQHIKKLCSIDIGGPPPGEIEVPAQVGDILAPENFVPVPEAIRCDPQLMYSLDMRDEWFGLCDRLNVPSGISRTYIDPTELSPRPRGGHD
ncbi:phage/plasmid replication protein, II/X family [Paraburkholderia sp. USG1]|uniref:phage/plasmid replication protein, II/X family n=1 Tax=Paraburkholderia sp. USG1 TaxID=2952268 RepID=UPI002866C947|nr:phage/plasmid replication protein, II/X family [Paraburkholderia sp. USG1]MDR8399756.1 phage/plasmid replication protein, II/X family [Paraburkholderia sp. USG1]